MGSASADLENKESEITIVYDDENLFAVNKPAGIVVHSDGRTKEPTLSDWVQKKYPHLENIGGLHTLDSGRYMPRFGILHRLDRETSGVILIAKNDDTFFFLQRQFIERTTDKIYHAFTLGVPAEREGVIDLPIGRSRSDFRLWTTGEDARGTLRKAKTHYKVMRDNGTYSYLELKPKTGRTHQLRVHLRTLGHPIICDKRYGSACALGFRRLALHALSIAIILPGGNSLTITAPVPSDFAAALGFFE